MSVTTVVVSGAYITCGQRSYGTAEGRQCKAWHCNDVAHQHRQAAAVAASRVAHGTVLWWKQSERASGRLSDSRSMNGLSTPAATHVQHIGCSHDRSEKTRAVSATGNKTSFDRHVSVKPRITGNTPMKVSFRFVCYIFSLAVYE